MSMKSRSFWIRSFLCFHYLWLNERVKYMFNSFLSWQISLFCYAKFWRISFAETSHLSLLEKLHIVSLFYSSRLPFLQLKSIFSFFFALDTPWVLTFFECSSSFLMSVWLGSHNNCFMPQWVNTLLCSAGRFFTNNWFHSTLLQTLLP